jgi:hypothetical protein
MSSEAGFKSSATKGHDEEVRAAQMAAWTRKNGKDDARNPYSRANCNPPTQRMVALALKKKAGRK